MGECFEQLSDWERTRIMVMKAEGRSVRAMARTLRRSPSTISRELSRNGHEGTYRVPTQSRLRAFKNQHLE